MSLLESFKDAFEPDVYAARERAEQVAKILNCKVIVDRFLKENQICIRNGTKTIMYDLDTGKGVAFDLRISFDIKPFDFPIPQEALDYQENWKKYMRGILACPA